MRYAKPTLRDSFFGWLGVSQPTPALDVRERQQQIRQRMIEALLAEATAGSGQLATQINGALDVDALWYQRTNLMQALSRIRGEEYARSVLAEITELFEGLLPAGMLSASFGSVQRKSVSH
jgi:hypothetical protein